MANINITSPEEGKTDTLTISISPKSMAHIREIMTYSNRAGLSSEQSFWYKVHDILYKGNITMAD